MMIDANIGNDVNLSGLVCNVPLYNLRWCTQCQCYIGVVKMTVDDGAADAWLQSMGRCPFCGGKLCYNNDYYNVSKGSAA